MTQTPVEPDGLGDDLEPERPVDNVIAEIITAIDAGQDVVPREWIARHPEFAPDLEEFFADLSTIDERFRKTGAVESTATVSRTLDRKQAERGDAPTMERPRLTDNDVRGARTFGRCYTLLKWIGGGGQGEVWKAFQSNPDRRVAIKIVKGGYLASSEEVRRFHSDAQIISRLDHPHIVPIYEVGEHEGHHYFSMKLMAGGSLKDRLADYKDRFRKIGSLMIEVAETVQFAHQHGIIHRDLKPANILFDSQDWPYLTDFGLAKRFGEAPEPTETGSILGPVPHELIDNSGAGATETGSIVGTLAYMSPEQASGENGVVTTASDVYGLGATLFTLLTGRPPFIGATKLEILEQVRRGNPISPSKLNPRIPADLAAICSMCLKKEPSDRYKTAQMVAEDLRNWLERKPTRARRVGRLGRLKKWCLRRPALAAALATVFLVTVLGAGAVFLQLRETQKAYASEARLNYFNRIALTAQAWADSNFGRAAELLAGCPTAQRGWEWYYLTRRSRNQTGFASCGGEIYPRG